MLFFSFFQFSNPLPEKLEERLEKSRKIIANTNLAKVQDSIVLIGWSKANITPVIKTRIVGYGWRNEFSGVYDSLFVRALVLENEGKIMAIVSLDLLLVTPNLKKAISNQLAERGVYDVYFSATHTHSSFGGYGKDVMGKFILSGYNEEIESFLIDQTVKSVELSIRKLDTLRNVNYIKQFSNESVNRLTHEREIKDVLRTINFKTRRKECKLISSNSHPTILGRKDSLLSNDYPGELMSDENDFSIFLAGTMGSLSPIIPVDLNNYKGKKYFSKVLSEGKKEAKRINLNQVSFNSFNLGRIKNTILFSKNLELRFWVFNLLVGKSENEVQTLRIGNLLMIALPCEMSYEYYDELEKLANAKGLELMLTTFNGSYLGYCTPSKHYDIEHMETREMNWIGKYGGDYFNEVIKMIIEKQ